MADGRFDRLSESVFPEFRSPTASNADTRVVMVLGHVLQR